jgi:hypothetical protein
MSGYSKSEDYGYEGKQFSSTAHLTLEQGLAYQIPPVCLVRLVPFSHV